MSSAPSPVDSQGHPPPSVTPSSISAHTHSSPSEDISTNGSHSQPNIIETRKTTRPSLSIQSNADRLLQVFVDEKFKLTHLYQKNLGVLEAQFNDYKAKSQAEIASMGQKEALQLQKIDTLEKELKEQKEELVMIKAAMGRAKLAYVDGEVKSAV
ncbi:hypothetical protein CPB83DRAFT_854605 [Crepidotus variabilis]|uniref:Uncharacterized protein n=1 Tax=Crepidotus variabilis TaxID=179855 RepID=A0A9P6EGB8_9AGAR|nr:hypothetical protein CPB83DRAFT_854605 [Crepidotus variabilis]